MKPAYDEATALLMAARMLITEPDAWTQRFYARNTEHQSVEMYNEAAVCFCGSGALGALSATYSVEADASARLIAAMGNISIPNFNDYRTHAEVLAAFDRAIEASP